MRAWSTYASPPRSRVTAFVGVGFGVGVGVCDGAGVVGWGMPPVVEGDADGVSVAGGDGFASPDMAAAAEVRMPGSSGYWALPGQSVAAQSWCPLMAWTVLV